MSESDVQRVRELIALECQALKRVFNEPSIVASHETINARYTNLGEHQQELEERIGKQQAAEEIVETYKRILG